MRDLSRNYMYAVEQFIIWTEAALAENGTLYFDQYFNRNATPNKSSAPQLRANTPKAVNKC